MPESVELFVRITGNTEHSRLGLPALRARQRNFRIADHTATTPGLLEMGESYRRLRNINFQIG